MTTVSASPSKAPESATLTDGFHLVVDALKATTSTPATGSWASRSPTSPASRRRPELATSVSGRRRRPEMPLRLRGSSPAGRAPDGVRAPGFLNVWPRWRTPQRIAFR